MPTAKPENQHFRWDTGLWEGRYRQLARDLDASAEFVPYGLARLPVPPTLPSTELRGSRRARSA